ncbi:hypothetical protein BO82DRAFT_54973 [Aspergillus uvarum CBS 121591]|uniref:Uncharacterized protein n=1 Tax=Aspergillus uvarum CBS 121591 TaxID=1448315 RepID=A0A319DFW5_9EURO|nr:hypothetical protein BO82DRAFT_54973 [Aspergillus uvarum CBS 121591]PYH86958.1 hypothetical protein BO82DRAFT_54973 [Aspergillus uvarum CBS 121591]
MLKPLVVCCKPWMAWSTAAVSSRIGRYFLASAFNLPPTNDRSHSSPRACSQLHTGILCSLRVLFLLCFAASV